MRTAALIVLACAAVSIEPRAAAAQSSEPASGSSASRQLIASEWSILITSNARANVEYVRGPDWASSLDVFWPDGAGPFPVVVYYHGGGWSDGHKADGQLFALPFLDMGFAVVNVGYRLTATASAPAAVEDAICAVRWVTANASTYRLDSTRVVLVGHSAGGHLALMAGMANGDARLARHCAAGS